MLLPRSRSILAASIILVALAIIAVALRLIVRIKRKIAVKADDWMIISSLLINIGLCAMNIYAASTNIFAVPIPELSPTQREKHELIIWLSVLIGTCVYGTVKFSVLLFYKRIFVIRSFHITANIIFAAVIGWMIATIFANIFSIYPVDLFWKRGPIFHEFNIDYGIFLFIISIFDMALDLIILILPFPIIKSLRISSNKKRALIGTFGLGFFCVVSSAVRTYYNWELHLISVGKVPFTDMTDLAASGILWSDIEASASIVAACLPIIATLFTNGSFVEAMRAILQHYIDRSRSLFPLRRLNGSSSGVTQNKERPPDSLGPRRSWYEVHTYGLGIDLGTTRDPNPSDGDATLQYPAAIKLQSKFEWDSQGCQV